MPPAGIEPEFPGSEGPQSQALDGAAIGSSKLQTSVL